MRVTPRVNPDGKVLMRVEPQVESVTSAPVSLGNGVLAPAFNVQTVQTTVLASDGETIVLGGLITKQDHAPGERHPVPQGHPVRRGSVPVPDAPVQRSEVLIIMTPHIIRSESDHARIPGRRVGRPDALVRAGRGPLHGHGMEVIGPAMEGALAMPVNPGNYSPIPMYPPTPDMMYSPTPGFVPPPVNAPQPQPQPGTMLGQPQPYQPGMIGQQPMTMPGGVQPPMADPAPGGAVPSPPPAAPPTLAQPVSLPGVPMMPISSRLRRLRATRCRCRTAALCQRRAPFKWCRRLLRRPRAWLCDGATANVPAAGEWNCAGRK